MIRIQLEICLGSYFDGCSFDMGLDIKAGAQQDLLVRQLKEQVQGLYVYWGKP